MIRTACSLLIIMTLLVGGVYPFLVTLVAQKFFPYQADGSLLFNAQGELIGSVLIGQKFQAPHYFWSRPSATEYKTLPSSGSNLGPTSKELQQQIQERTTKLKEANPDVDRDIPADLLYASGSGLDPHISKKAMRFQIARVLKARGLEDQGKIESIFEEFALNNVWEGPFNYFNVLEINYELDQQFPISNDTKESTVEQS